MNPMLPSKFRRYTVANGLIEVTAYGRRNELTGELLL